MHHWRIKCLFIRLLHKSIIHTLVFFPPKSTGYMANVLRLMSDISHGENWVERVLGLSLQWACLRKSGEARGEQGQRGVVHRSHCRHPSHSTLPVSPRETLPVWLCPYANIHPHTNTHKRTSLQRGGDSHQHTLQHLWNILGAPAPPTPRNTHPSLAIFS